MAASFSDLFTELGVSGHYQYDILWNIVLSIAPVDGESSAIIRAINLIISLLMIFGSGILGWHVLSGIVHSAYTGQVLGKRWHQIWAPIRVVLGFGLLAPLPSGYNSAQLLLTNVIFPASINITNMVIKQVLEDVIVENKTINGFSGYTSATNLASNLLNKEVCSSVSQAYKKVTGTIFGSTSYPYVTGGSCGDTIEKSWWNPFESYTHYYVCSWDYGSTCGSIIFKTYYNYDSSSSEENIKFFQKRKDATDIMMKSIQSSVGTPLYNWLNSNSNAFNTTDPETIKNYASSAGINSSQLSTFLKNYASTWSDYINQYAKETSDNKTEATTKVNIMNLFDNYGATVVGVINTYMSQKSAFTSALTNETASVTEGNIKDSIYYKNFEGILKVIEGTVNNGSINSLSATDLTSVNDDTSVSDRITQAITKYITEGISSYLSLIKNGDGSSFSLTNQNALQNFYAGGQILLGIAEGIFAAYLLLSIPATGGSLGTAIPALIFLGSVIMFGLFGMFSFGIMVGYIAPVLPMITIFQMLLAWATTVIESLLLVPLFALWLIRMDGEELFERANAPALMIFFGIFLRPVITCVALIAMIPLFNIVFNAIDLFWNIGFFGSVGDTVVGIVGGVVAVGGNLYIKWHIITRGYAYVFSITERMGEWVGGRVSSGMNEAGEIHGVIGGVVNVGRSVGSATQQGFGGAMSGKKAAAASGGDTNSTGTSKPSFKETAKKMVPNINNLSRK